MEKEFDVMESMCSASEELLVVWELVEQKGSASPFSKLYFTIVGAL